MIQSLLCLIRTYTEENPSDWEEALPLLQYAINDAYCNSTRTTPFKVIYGDSPTPPMSWRKTTVEKITSSKPCVASSDSTDNPPVDTWHDVVEDLDPPEDEDNTELDLADYQVWLAHKLTSIHRFILHYQNQAVSRMKARADAKRRDPGLQTDDC